MYHLQREQRVLRPLDEVFGFFDKPGNLALITPGWMGFEILTPSPPAMHRGAVIDYALRLGPFPGRWRSLITTYEPLHCFVDEQLSGPYSFWHHTHRFEEVPGGTLVTDHVRYLLPLGPAGKLAHALFVRRMLEGIFDHRIRAVEERFGSTGSGDG